MFIDWNILFSIITGLAAIIALVLTFIQIRLSNKQSLFEKRLECYLKIEGLIKLYKNNRKLLEINRKDEPLFAVESEFLWLTNNTYLEEVGEAIITPLKEPVHKKFLVKCEELERLSVETELVFAGNEVEDISSFISGYGQLLVKMYQYQICLKKMHEYSEQFNVTLDKAQETVKEHSFRKELLNAYEDIKKAYFQIVCNDGMNKIKKQIKL